MSYRGMSKMFLPLILGAIFGPVLYGKSTGHRMIIETLRISKPTVVNGTTIQPGEYQLVVKRNELKVETSSYQVLAESPITWKRLSHSVTKTKMDIDKGELTKVNLGGTDEAVLLHNTRKSGGGIAR